MTDSSGTRRPRRWSGWRIAVVVLAFFVTLRGFFMLFGSAPPVGLVDGKLRPCPKSPNCVCSQAADAVHAIEPLRFSGSAEVAWKRLRKVLSQLPRARIVVGDEHYLRAEFTTRIMRYVDDVEFLLDEATSTIQVRSASRVGYSDLGMNRKRVEAIRQLFLTDLQLPPATGQATETSVEPARKIP